MVDFYPLPLFDSNFEMILSPGQKFVAFALTSLMWKYIAPQIIACFMNHTLGASVILTSWIIRR